MMSSTLKALSSCCFGRLMTWRVMPSSAAGNAFMSSAAKARETETNQTSAMDTIVLIVLAALQNLKSCAPCASKSGDLEYSNMGIDSRQGAKHAKFGIER